MRKWIMRGVGALIVMTISVSIGSAQSGAGSIEGTVTDQTGAVIPDATVHVVNKATSVTRDAKTNGAGIYHVPALFAGKYAVKIAAPGMGQFETSIELLVDQHAVINASLSAGSVTTQVVVTADDAAQLVTTNSGTVAYDLDTKRIDQLPQNGRLLLNLATSTSAGLEPKGTGNLMVNGLEAESMEFVSDGVPLTNRQFGGVNQTQGQLPDPDAVSEVRIETTNVGAEYATPGIAIITTKSGTNAFHGSIFETARNNAIGIAKNRNNLSNFVAPHLVRNEFGGSFGGPIIIPHVYNGRDKSFFFFAYERFSNSQKQSQLAYVPETAWRTGDFSSLLKAPTPVQLYDPQTTHDDPNCNGSGQRNKYCRAPFANNQIPISRISPTAKVLFNITPQPSNGDNIYANSNGNLSTFNPMFTVIPNYSARVDHNFSESKHAYVRFTSINQINNNLRNNPSSPASLAADGLPANANGLSLNPTKTFAAAAGFTSIFSPSFFSETVISQQWFSQHNYAGGCPECNFEKQLGLPNNFGNLGFPQIGDNQIANGNGGFNGTQYIYGLSQIIWNADENLTKTFGRHKLQFGGRYRLERFNDLPDQSADTVNFNGQGTALNNPNATQISNPGAAAYNATPNTGARDADFFLGNASSYGVNQLPGYFKAHDMELDAYIQDTFRVTPKLTLNLGLRWEDHPSALVQDGLFNTFDYQHDALVLGAPLTKLIADGRTTQAVITNMQNLGAKFETAQEAGLPSTLMRNYPWNFLPRVGVAYQPLGSGGPVLRGGYGRYIYPIPTRSFLKNPIQNAPFVSKYTQDWSDAALTPDGLPNALLRFPQGSGSWSSASQFLPVMGVNSTNLVNTNSITGIKPGVAVTTPSPNLAPDFVTETNVTVEQPFKGNQALRVSWVYTHGTNLDHQFQPNNAPSAFVWEMATGTVPNTANGSIATRPYDHTAWGQNIDVQKNGWSNYNALQVNYEKRARNGVAYQVLYAWAKAFRIGGNSFRDGVTTPYANYLGALGTAGGTTYSGIGTSNFIAGGAVTSPVLPLPPAAGTPLWTDYHDLIRFENYVVDTAVPSHHIRFNGVVDLPFGRNKRFLGGSNRLLDEVVGGWQIAGVGQVISQAFFVNAGNWGAMNPIKSYGHGRQITDCQNTCQPAKLWFNGFIAPTANAIGKVSGLPEGYNVNSAVSPAYAAPINFTGTGGVITGTNNNVNITGPSGTIKDQGFSPGPTGTNPYSRTALRGPFNYNVDLSAYKVFPIKEGMFLRLNVDAFNALNIQGFNNPNTTTGEILYAGNGLSSSYWTPRQIQVSARFTF
jgi:hypothetical protein